MRVLAGIFGGILLVVTVGSILRNLIVPRGKNSILVNWLSRGTRMILHGMAWPFGTYEAYDRVLVWLARSQLTFLDFAAAATGPLVIAVQISYLPMLYGAYNRRETEVTLLRSRAGEPPWGPELLARQALVGTLGELSGLYSGRERLSADIGESHANYPVLLTFRSPRPYRSWIVSLLTVMDAASLHMALAPSSEPAAAARIMVRAGFTALRDIARVANIPFDSDPLPTDPIELQFGEYREAVLLMQRAGFVTERTIEQSWTHFRGWREPMPPRRPLDRKPLTE